MMNQTANRDHRAVFEPDEYRRRITATKARMEEAGLDVVLCPDPSNINYLTGYDGWSFYTPQMAVLAADDDLPFLVTREMDVNTARMSAFLPDERLIGFPETLVHVVGDHPMRFAGEVLKARGYGSARIGIDHDAHYLSPAGLAALKAALPDARFADCGRLVNWVRAVKSDAEIAIMREAALLADHVMATAVETIAPGVQQTDLAAAISAAQYGGTDGIGGDYPAIVPLIMTGEGSSAPHITPRVTPIGDSGVTVLELTGVRHRYHCPISRTVHLGNPPRLITDTISVVTDGMAAVVCEMKAGQSAEDVHAAWRRTVEPHGITKASRIGYAVGLGYPPDWGESTISIRQDEATVLEENQTVHIMLGIWNEGWGVSVSNVVRVGASEGETLANMPTDLIVK
jgi:Xaa-Pro aminopeptidase